MVAVGEEGGIYSAQDREWKLFWGYLPLQGGGQKKGHSWPAKVWERHMCSCAHGKGRGTGSLLDDQTGRSH